MDINILDKVKDSTQSFKEKIIEFKEDMIGEEQGEIIKEFKDGGVNKVKSVLDNMNNSTAVFLRTGYELKNVTVTLGLPPVITASFHYNNKISDEERAQILEATKEQKIIHILVSCLMKADDFYEMVKMGEYKLGTVTISLGLAPSVSISFVK